MANSVLPTPFTSRTGGLAFGAYSPVHNLNSLQVSAKSGSGRGQVCSGLGFLDT